MNNYRYQAKKLSKTADISLKKIQLEDKHFEIKWDQQGYPILPAIRFNICFYAWCIYCDRWHIHGVGNGHRVAHCTEATPYKDKGYIIEGVV